MKPQERKHPSISLRAELETVRYAIDGARVLADAVRHHELGSDADERAAQHAHVAILSLAVTRMRLIDNVLAGVAEAGTLAAPHNAFDSVLAVDDDIVIAINPRGRR